MIDRMNEKAPKKDSQTEEIKFTVKNQAVGSEHPKSFSISITEKTSLSQIKENISQIVNPPIAAQNIQIVVSGRFLGGEGMTVKEMNLKSGQTLIVSYQ